MTKLYAWSKIINQNIQSNKEKIHKKDYKFYKVDRIEKMSYKLEDNSDSCQICKEFMSELEMLSLDFPEYINGSFADKSDFEKKHTKIFEHLMKFHNFVPELYYASRFSLFGIILGTLFGFFIGNFFSFVNFRFSVLVGFALGLTVGRVLGVSKDKQKEKQKLVI